MPIKSNIPFPAKLITTEMEWENLVLNDATLNQVMEIHNWLVNTSKIQNDWGFNKKVQQGYRALFYGPPGTGKTLTATLLGKISKRDVYKVDFSLIVSTYIGETEKNLAMLFDVSQEKDWILFFDEADTLFGKQTAVKSSKDLYANQQTTFFLQRIESFPGAIIVSSNFKSNIDEAFTRRFHNIIHFPFPNTDERFLLWKNAFSASCRLDRSIDLHKIAEDFKLSGGSISNILHNCELLAAERHDTIVTKQELMTGIRNEFKKKGITIAKL